MSRGNDYQFISTDTNALVAKLISSYEQIAGVTVQPASPERLFIQWIASVIIQERALNNYTGNQNIPSRASNVDLDALGELFYDIPRPEAKAAICTERLHISEEQSSAILIPAGSRITDMNNTLVWETIADAYIPIGETYIDVLIRCQTAGTIGNGYAPGQINTMIDLYPYFSHCENITESDGGADQASDDEYYKLMRASEDEYSTAGPMGAYISLAKKVSTEIGDVVANSPSDGQVSIYVLMKNGTPAGTEIKNAVLAACTPKDTRPMTDYVVVDDPDVVSYNIEFTYYVPTDTPLSAAEIEEAVAVAVAEYVAWQSAKLGRDINPSYLTGLLMKTGIKRVEMDYPEYTPLSDGSDDTVPQVASVDTITITNGGYEDE